MSEASIVCTISPRTPTRLYGNWPVSRNWGQTPIIFDTTIASRTGAPDGSSRVISVGTSAGVSISPIARTRMRMRAIRTRCDDGGKRETIESGSQQRGIDIRGDLTLGPAFRHPIPKVSRDIG